MDTKINYTAVVQKIFPRGKHGPYAMATIEEGREKGISVTFSLNKDIWKERRWPETGEFVILASLTRKRAGWRADQARFMDLEDETNTKGGEKNDRKAKSGKCKT